MGIDIKSTITISGGCQMNDKKRHHHYKSIAHSHKNRLFHQVKGKSDKGVIQNVEVEVNIDQKDDCMTSCFKGLAGMFKK